MPCTTDPRISLFLPPVALSATVCEVAGTQKTRRIPPRDSACNDLAHMFSITRSCVTISFVTWCFRENPERDLDERSSAASYY